MATLAPATRPTVPVLRDRELEARILERIDDPAAYAVYGDWLSERGDPRGELVALQLALAAGYDQATAERAQRLLDEYAWDWLGKLAWLDGDELLLEWRHGFVKEVWFGDVEAASARGTDTQIEELARLPSMALVQRIEIGPKGLAR
jgi:uncharacterized protein (TIGR02996 family)